MSNTRPPIPKIVLTQVLHASRRRCALCVGLDSDYEEKNGQIAHIDRDNKNNEFANLAFLCLPHHDKYDSQTSQSKRITPEELVIYRDELIELLKSGPVGAPEALSTRAKPRGGRGGRISLAIYERRITIYRAVTALLSEVSGEGGLELTSLREFRAATDECLFLFDNTVADRVADLYRHGARLHTSCKLGANDRLPADVRERAWDENEKELMWFDGQYASVRLLLYPYLRLASE